MTETPKRLIIGIGNRLRRDDAIGPLVMDRLQQLGIPCTEHSGEGVGLMHLWEDHDWVLVIDAMQSSQPPGSIHLIDTTAEEIPTDLFHYSSHQFGLAQAVEMARTLNRLPQQLWILGIEGVDFDYGEQLTPTVAAAIDPAIRQVISLAKDLAK